MGDSEQLLRLKEKLRRETAERRRVEEALKKAQESLAAVQRIAHLGNWDWDIVNDVLCWSDEIYRIFGLSRESFKPGYEAFLASVHPDDRELVRESVRRALEERAPYHLDHRIVAPSGEARVVHERGEVTCDDSGKPIRMIGTVLDVTDTRRAEEALRAHEALLRAVLDSLPVGVWLINADGYIREANPAALRIWGGAKLVGLQQYSEYKGWWLDSGRPLTSGEWAAVRAITKGETVLGQVIEIEAFDGQRKTITTSAIPLTDRHGKIQGAIAVAEEITDRVRFEKALEYSTRLLDASRTELRSLSKHLDDRVEEERKLVSRELQDQMGSSLIAAKLALNALAQERAADSEVCERMQKTVALIDGALESVKRVAFGLRPFLLDHLGLGAAIEAQTRVFERETGIRCACVASAPEPLELDPIAAMTLFRIAQEALDNVAKHAEATEVAVKLDSSAGCLTLEIIDNGKGIAPGQLLAQDSLGLAGMRERATRLGGDVSIENVEGGGASVIVRVPVTALRLH